MPTVPRRPALDFTALRTSYCQRAPGALSGCRPLCHEAHHCGQSTRLHPCAEPQRPLVFVSRFLTAGVSVANRDGISCWTLPIQRLTSRHQSNPLLPGAFAIADKIARALDGQSRTGIELEELELRRERIFGGVWLAALSTSGVHVAPLFRLPAENIEGDGGDHADARKRNPDQVRVISVPQHLRGGG